MTEDDTYNILRRIPVNETLRRRNELFHKLLAQGCFTDERNRQIEMLTLKCGWETENEYYKALTTYVDEEPE